MLVMGQVLSEGTYIISIFDAVQCGCKDMFTPDATVTLGAAATHYVLTFKHQRHVASCLLHVRLTTWWNCSRKHETWQHSDGHNEHTPSIISYSRLYQQHWSPSLRLILVCQQHLAKTRKIWRSSADILCGYLPRANPNPDLLNWKLAHRLLLP